MQRQIFISLTEADTAIAEALRSAFYELFGKSAVMVHFSSSKTMEGSIRSGQDWFQWIVDRVKECDFALILITPTSVHKPWIIWEAGAVAGVAMATSSSGMNKVRPIVYQIPTDLIPSPIKDSKAQYRKGDEAADIKMMLKEMLRDLKDELDDDQTADFGGKVDGVIETYLRQVRQSLLDAPAIMAPAVIEEWCLRLDNLIREKRASEAEQLQDWMDLTFGRAGRPQPLDLRIHSRLAALYMKARNYKRAITQLELARQLAPRDIYVLRQLGQAQLNDKRRDEAKKTLDRIAELDKTAPVRNAECAALAARWCREGGELKEAEAVLSKALAANAQSYYLANLLAEVCADDKRPAEAATAYRQVVQIIEALADDSVWVKASLSNARFFLGEDEAVIELLREIEATNPDAGTRATIDKGLNEVAARVDNGFARLSSMLAQARA
jgi:tetratricopeptide (TPR) repeat protein